MIEREREREIEREREREVHSVRSTQSPQVARDHLLLCKEAEVQGYLDHKKLPPP